jgi:hypothetical protein
MTRNISKSYTKCFFSVTLMLFNQILSSVFEKRQDIFVDILEVLKDISGRCFDDIFWLWDSDSVKLDSG